MIHFETQDSANSDVLQQLEQCWQKVLARPEVGFPKLSEAGPDWLAVAARVKHAKPAKKIVVVGIGGSSLGTQVIAQALATSSAPQIYFLESPDPHSLQRLGDLQSAEWRERHLIFVSKSGNTLETLAWIERLNAVDANFLKGSEVTVIASPGEGPLQQWAKREGYATLWIPANVGGRFSVLTAVGMLPAGLLGLNLDEFRAGAAWAVQNSGLASRVSASILQSWERGEWITQLWSYSESLRIFGEWWQQLWGESLGKRLDRTGGAAMRASTPMACLGPRDQHSLVQQLMEGARDKFVLISRVDAVENDGDKFMPSLFPGMPFAGRQMSFGKVLGAEAQAFERSLSESGIHHASMRIEKVDAKSLGAMFMLWQMVIAQLGEYMQIDAFNQPGVESGKKHAFAILKG